MSDLVRHWRIRRRLLGLGAIRLAADAGGAHHRTDVAAIRRAGTL